MQAYSRGLARVYGRTWAGFAQQVAPLILDFYAATPIGERNKSVLDVCCGTGELAVHFLKSGYKVVCIDLSEHMLSCAEDNAREYVQSGQARFVQGNASGFTLDERFGLVVSTFDALNHLENEQTLRSCFRSVYAVSDGYFIFDLNTRRGLRRWNGIQLDESSEDLLILTRGVYDGESDRAWTKITGFVRVANGLWERFDEAVFNTVFEMEKVKATLLAVGWKSVHFARIEDLKTPLPEPEREGRVFVVARK
jgi:SAM-dependent methyltransferase